MVKLTRKINKEGWAGWEGGEIYTAIDAQSLQEVDNALQKKAKETGRGAAVLTSDNCLYGWGYTDKRYKDGPYFYPFFIESDSFVMSGRIHIENRTTAKDET